MKLLGSSIGSAIQKLRCPVRDRGADIEIRLLQRSDETLAIVVDGEPALAADIAACDQATIHPARDGSETARENGERGLQCRSFLSDPAKFIERFVRNREHGHP